jgi:hypothetical protein
MRPLAKVLFLLALTLSIYSCKKDNPAPGDTVKKLPVLYFLTQQDKELIGKFSQDTLHFVEHDGTVIWFLSDGLRYQDWYYEFEARRGEQIILYFTCQSNYIPTFKIGYQLYALGDSTSSFEVCNISGYLNQSNPMFYDASVFRLKFDPYDPDSIFRYIPEYSFELLDSVNLKSGTFYHVYFLKNPSSFGDELLTKYWYFNKSYGIIGFENLDGTIWSLVLE